MTTKLKDTNSRIRIYEAKLERSLNENALKSNVGLKNRKQKTEWSKKLKRSVKN